MLYLYGVAVRGDGSFAISMQSGRLKVVSLYLHTRFDGLHFTEKKISVGGLGNAKYILRSLLCL